MKIVQSLALSMITCLVVCSSQAQSELLQSGPMVGYADMKEVMLWVQTKSSARVKLVYWDQAHPSQKLNTEELITTKDKAYAVHLLADQVQPGKKYQYELFINGKKVSRPYALEFQTQELWVWRKDPPAFSFAMGSCAYIHDKPFDRPGKPYGDTAYQIFKSIHQKKPDLMVWLGDNVYLREADWNTKTGIFYRYTHTRSTPDLQPLLGSVHHYAMWDDHEYGPDNSDRGFWNKKITEEAFNLFWCNPNTNLTGHGGITSTFYWNDVQFFLLDDRYFRTADHNPFSEKKFLGDAQLEWLIEALSSSPAIFKIIAIGGQVLSTAPIQQNYINYVDEHQKLLSMIKEAKIPGIIFLSGDRHHTELSALQQQDFYTLYDFTISPFTSGTHQPKQEGNTLQVPGTLVNEYNFAVAEVTGSLKDRKIKFSIYDKWGVLKWDKTISASELKPPKN